MSVKNIFKILKQDIKTYIQRIYLVCFKYIFASGICKKTNFKIHFRCFCFKMFID